MQVVGPRRPRRVAGRSADPDALSRPSAVPGAGAARFRGFAERLLEEREQAGFPPFVFEACLRAEAPHMADALAFLQRARDAAPEADAGLTLYDPVPMTLARQWPAERAQVLLQAASRRALQSFLREWSAPLYAMKPGPVRWHLDVDPVEF